MLSAFGKPLGAVASDPGPGQPEERKGDHGIQHQLPIGEAGYLHGDQGDTSQRANNQADFARYLE